MNKRQQWAGWGPHEQAEQHYLIEPRHLAGGGDLRHVTKYLRASGWSDRSKSGGPLAFDSPDRTIRVGYDPFIQPGGWMIRAEAANGQPAWHVTLGRQTPVEIVAGFTDALTQPRTAHAPNAWAPLQQNGWQTKQGHHPTATSPDSSSWMQFHQTAPDEAFWWAGARTEHGMTWQAHFAPTTPIHLVQAFSAALADPQPVMRPRGNVPPSNRIRSTSVSVLPSQLSAWQQTRINAARAATWARNTWATNRPRNHTASPYAAAGSTRARR
ncbi:DUF317 domain-containing protein [Streptomyces sp. NPDC093589]|uniref:DUF317 domain-containing protein n=1 Tax=Streptomyces sp. NPDC093589 TaxID=3366043 RepID=UPI0037F96568